MNNHNNPLFKMSTAGSTTGSHGVGHGHSSLQPPGSSQNSISGVSNATPISHPSTASHQTSTTATTAVNDNKSVNTTSNSINTSVAPTTNTTTGMQMFERANFKDSIMIHVIDDTKNEKRDFTFSRSLLVKYMKYFDRCLKKISDNDEIDISIHCDAVIFEWLLNYIYAMEEYEKKQAEQEKLNRSSGPAWKLRVHPTNKEGDDNKKNNFANSAIMQYGGPKLDIKNAVTILIPAEFLKIDRLVRECLDFIGQNIE